MSKNYNLKQKKHSDSDQTFEELSELKMTHKHDRRKNEILNGFVFMIGIVGFVVVFMLPRDGVYSNANLEKSFTNSSPLASSSLVASEMAEEEDWGAEVSTDLLGINGFREAAEVLEFDLKSYQPNSEVVYTIHFGNGDSREISDKVTFYKYSNSGNYVVSVTAKYHEDVKQIFSENISIDEAILVNREAFVERN